VNVQTLGKIIQDEGAYRDAVHVAVAPVVAAATLAPGQHVSVQDGAAYGSLKQPIGVVDPFLKRSVEKGQRFWLFLYPQTITSLRHEWSHPAFPEDLGRRNVALSRAWIEHWGDRYGLTVDDAIDYAIGYLDHGDLLFRGEELEGESVPIEFWDHFETVTGRRVSAEERGSFFSCSC
jgi:hypothetical protein